MRYTSDVTMQGSASNNERVSLRITGRCAASRSESLFLSAEAASLHDSRGEELRGINRTTVARIGAERDIKIETSRIEYLSISMCLLRVARNLFSTTLNESHCRRENNPQKTARQYLPPPPTLDIPHSARRGEITTLSLSRSRGNSARNFVLRPSSSGGRQSPISRSTEIQFKPLITTELSVHCLPCPPVPPPPSAHSSLSSYHFLQPPSPRPHLSGPPLSRLASERERGMGRRGGGAGGCVYFSNLKSYLLISYVSPPRLGIFTEAIVSRCSANGSHCSYARAPRARYRFYLVYFFSLFRLLALSDSLAPLLPSSPWYSSLFFFFNRV